MKVGFFIGRFQPLHRGHLLLIKKLASTVDRFIIGIGSSNTELSCRNPFSAFERREMIKRGMKEIGITNYEIVEIPDKPNDDEWILMLKKYVGKFDLAWSGSEVMIRLFKKAGIPAKSIKEFLGISGSKIRKRITQGQAWLRLVPLSTRRYMKEIKAVKRVRLLCKPQ